jgi:hypothetical protein
MPFWRVQASRFGNLDDAVFDPRGTMAKKSDFTELEWESMQKGVTGAGLLVSLSDRSFFDTFKEAGALGKHIAQAKQSNSSEFIRELAETRGTGFGFTTSPDKVEKRWMRCRVPRRRSRPRLPTSWTRTDSSWWTSHGR